MLQKRFCSKYFINGKMVISIHSYISYISNIKPYIKDLIDNEYVLDIGLGISIFVIVIFLILMINKGISKAVKYTGIGSLDTMFGFFFGFIRAYIISVCIFSVVHIVYNYDKWPINLDKSYIFPYLEKGSNYLLKELPNEKTYQDSKEKSRTLILNKGGMWCIWHK